MSNLQQVCGDLVDRARAGDQNAMALITEVGKSAKLGSPKAKESKALIEKYIKDNPPPKLNSVGGIDIDTGWTRKMSQYVGTVQAAFEGDEVGDLQPIIALLPFMQEYGVTTLSNGPNLTNDIICCIAANFPSEAEETAFKFGVANSDQADKMKKNIAKLNRPAAYAVLIGCLVGEARRIQLVRNPKNPISILCKDAARELGET
jgi:hypothetical protein